jgi:hypothetical protein
MHGAFISLVAPQPRQFLLMLGLEHRQFHRFFDEFAT